MKVQGEAITLAMEMLAQDFVHKAMTGVCSAVYVSVHSCGLCIILIRSSGLIAVAIHASTTGIPASQARRRKRPCQ